MPMYEPRPSRFGVNQRIVLVRRDGSEVEATIANISQTGFRLKLAQTPMAGEKVAIRGAAGDVPAQIRWASGNAAGGVFLRPEDD